MNTMPPVEFSQIGLSADTFKRSDARSWRGACPSCGGSRRYVIFTDHDFPLWHGFCDECGRKDKYWQDFRAARPVSEADVMRRREAEKRAEDDRARFRADKLKSFTDAELWNELHDRMGARQREWWAAQGIGEDWQDYLGLGWVADKPYRAGGELFHSEAYTIPYFHFVNGDKTFRTLQYRLSAAPTADRYRFEYGMSADYYQVMQEPMVDTVLVCEGAKKAIVARAYLEDKMTVLAVPSNSSTAWFGLPALLADCGRVYVCLDPDATGSAVKLAQSIGRQARIVTLFEKLDDMVLDYGMTARDFRAQLRQAV